MILVAALLSAESGCDFGGDLDPTGDALGVRHQALSSSTTVAPTSGFGAPGTVTTVDAGGNVNWVGGTWYVPLPTSAGDTIGTVSAIVRDNAGQSGNNVIVQLVSRTSSGDTSRSFASSNGSGIQQTLTMAPTGGYKVQVGDEMLVEYFGLKGGAIPGPSTVPSMTGPVTVTPVAPIVVSRTVIIPVSAPSIAPPSSFVSATVTGTGTASSVLTVPLGGSAGSTLVAVRARVTDSAGAPVSMQLAVSGDSAQDLRVFSGPSFSTGSGGEQTITLSPGVVEVGSRRHFAIFNATTPSTSDTIWSLEADYQ